MVEMKIIAIRAKTKPNYKRMAPILLALCREFYQDPENEKAYQEWKAQQESEKQEAEQ